MTIELPPEAVQRERIRDLYAFEAACSEFSHHTESLSACQPVCAMEAALTLNPVAPGTEPTTVVDRVARSRRSFSAALEALQQAQAHLSSVRHYMEKGRRRQGLPPALPYVDWEMQTELHGVRP
jgi:hypothetical protein